MEISWDADVKSFCVQVIALILQQRYMKPEPEPQKGIPIIKE